MFVVVDDACRVFVDECFRQFSAALLDDGVYSTLCKETSRYIQAVNTAVEQSVLAFTLSDRCQLQPVALIVSLHLLLLLFFVAWPEITWSQGQHWPPQVISTGRCQRIWPTYAVIGWLTKTRT